MPIQDSIIAGTPCWVGLGTSDPARALDFYGRIFGWTYEDAGEEYGHYTNFSKDGVMVAGMAESTEDMGPDAWTIYLSSLDADATLQSVTAAGGTVQMPSMRVGEFGTMAIIADNSGATLGVWQPDQHRGFGVKEEPGTPSWFELVAKNYNAAVEFYRSAFGWQTKALDESPEFNYTIAANGDAHFAGIMDASEISPEPERSAWSVYFGVSDVDATIAMAVENGGKLVDQPQDTPYGRLAGLTDPTGAYFKLCSVGS